MSMVDELATRIVGETIASIRRQIGWSQRELARRAGLSQAMVCAIENGRVRNVTFRSAQRLLAAMGGRLRISVDAPFLRDRQHQLEPVHARCSAHVATRLRRDGWQVATEVEIGGDRSRGWIDLLAFHPALGTLLVIEIKTEIRDFGAIERALGWYEREGRVAARRRGWQPRRTLGCLLLLATEANDVRVAANRASFVAEFPTRARDLAGLAGGTSVPAQAGRAVAMIDPRSRRRAWLRPLRIDGRRSPAPYLDYADFMRATRDRAGRPASGTGCARG